MPGKPDGRVLFRQRAFSERRQIKPDDKPESADHDQGGGDKKHQRIGSVSGQTVRTENIDARVAESRD